MIQSKTRESEEIMKPVSCVGLGQMIICFFSNFFVSEISESTRIFVEEVGIVLMGERDVFDTSTVITESLKIKIKIS